MPELPPPPANVEVVVVYPPRLAPLGGEAAFSAVQVGPEVFKTAPRLDEALKTVPGVSLFRRTGSVAANPTTQGLSLRSIAPSGAGRALVTLDGAPVNDPFGGWVIWTALPTEGLEGATVVRGAGAGPYGAGALTGVVALQERGARDGLGAFDVSAAERNGYRIAASGGGPGTAGDGGGREQRRLHPGARAPAGRRRPGDRPGGAVLCVPRAARDRRRAGGGAAGHLQRTQGGRAGRDAVDGVGRVGDGHPGEAGHRRRRRLAIAGLGAGQRPGQQLRRRGGQPGHDHARQCRIFDAGHRLRRQRRAAGPLGRRHLGTGRRRAGHGRHGA